MNTKMLIGGILGGLTFFLLGFLIYGVLMANSADPGNCMRPHDGVLMIWIAVGNLFTGFLLAYIFSRWASISTFVGGATAGAVIGLLNALGSGFLWYGTTTCVNDLSGVLIEAAIAAVMWAIAGGVVGWWLGRKA